jgi:hypothetical protein
MADAFNSSPIMDLIGYLQMVAILNAEFSIDLALLMRFLPGSFFKFIDPAQELTRGLAQVELGED